MMKNEDILIGADPEFFTYDKSVYGYRSCHTFMKGNKRKPYPLKNGAVQVDGTAIEFNIHPTNDPKEFAKSIDLVLNEIREMVPDKYTFEFVPHVKYDKQYFKTLPFENIELGCDPDYDAATGKMNPKPTPSGDYETMRTGAGHIHIGWTKGADVSNPSHLYDAQTVTKAVDAFFRSSGIIYFWDQDKERIKLYGGTAAYRPKSYGVEYRSLSNAWLNYPKLWPWIAETAQCIVSKLVNEGTYVKPYVYSYYTNDIEKKRVISELNSQLPKEFPKLDFSFFEKKAV